MTVLPAAAFVIPAAIYVRGCVTLPTMKLRIGAYPSEMTAPVAAAGEKGFFRSNGLDEVRWFEESGLAGASTASTAPDCPMLIDFTGLERTAPDAVEILH